ncbi:MAG: hypothetical protein ACKPKO_63905, partial [Candidatus Fonsibacter sp.]
VEQLFREFNFPAPPERPMPDRPKVTVKAGKVDQRPGGAGPLPGPIGGDDDEGNIFGGWPVRRSGQIYRSDLPSSYGRYPPPEVE